MAPSDGLAAVHAGTTSTDSILGTLLNSLLAEGDREERDRVVRDRAEFDRVELDRADKVERDDRAELNRDKEETDKAERADLEPGVADCGD